MSRRVTYEGKDYGIIDISYKNIRLPVIMDWADAKTVYDMDKTWRCNKSGHIYCNHKIDGKEKDVFLHDVIMYMSEQHGGSDYDKKSNIVHINRLGIDNRRENLMYDTVNKSVGKNLKKKKRTITLPKDSGINVDEIPTYIWYMKPDSSHGERFMVSVGDVKWKTPSSKKLSLHSKLDLAKDYLKNLKTTRPDIFEKYSMNGDYNKQGKYLVNSFYDIIHKGGYKHIKRFNHVNNTEKLLN